MPVYKLIYRLDFQPKFEILDSVGKILTILRQQEFGDPKQRVYPILNESASKRLISGRSVSSEDGYLYSIDIEPTSITGQVETIKGIPLLEVEKTDIFKRLSKTTNRIRQEFGLTEFDRAGLRFYVMDALPYDLATVHQGFYSVFPTVKDALAEEIGGFSDMGIQVNGCHDDGIKFNFKCGPYLKDFDKIMGDSIIRSDHQAHIDDLESNLRMTYDIDFYEKGKDLALTTSLRKWCVPLAERAVKAISVIETKVIENIGALG